MKLIRLNNIYRELKIHNENYFIFSFKKNDISFEILFDIYKEPFKLHFLQKCSNFHFHINVEKGFNIDPNLQSDIYKRLCKVLNLKYDPNNRFSTYIFFNEFNEKIPDYSHRKKEKRELFKFYTKDIEEPNKINFGGFIDWKKLNNGKNVSEKNLEKTRILYPEYYEYCKRENVSIIYKSNIEE